MDAARARKFVEDHAKNKAPERIASDIFDVQMAQDIQFAAVDGKLLCNFIKPCVGFECGEIPLQEALEKILTAKGFTFEWISIEGRSSLDLIVGW